MHTFYGTWASLKYYTLKYEGFTGCLVDRPCEHFILAAREHVKYLISEILKLDFKFEK